MPKVSIFKNISECEHPLNMDIEEYLEKTRDGEWQDYVIALGLLKEKKERDDYKKTVLTTTLSGEFHYRNETGLTKHSGFMNIDLDHVINIDQVFAQLRNDKYACAVWKSISQDGLRFLFKIDHLRHRDAYKGMSSYLHSEYGLGYAIDPNGISLSKPYLVSYDPYLYKNPFWDEVPVFKKYIKETVVKPIIDFVHTTKDFQEVLNQITGRHLNICEDYHDYLKIGFAFADHFGEDGRGFFHEVCKQSSKYKYQDAEYQYNRCLKGRGTSKATIQTFYYFAKNAGATITTEQTRLIVRSAKNGKKSGLSREKVIENLKKFSEIEGADEVVNYIFDNKSEQEEEEESILHQLETFISHSYSLRMNQVTGYLEQNGISQTPSDLNTIFVASKKIIPKLDYPLMMRLLKSDFVETYNPFFEFFNSDGIPTLLPPMYIEDKKEWKSPLIDKLAKCIENDKPGFTHKFLRKWLVSIISSMHGVHSPLLLCLLGKQNSGKTEFFRRLLPSFLKRYYAESKLDKGKDDELLMCENILIMDDELGGKSKQDNQKLKNITSVEYFYIRRPYGDHNERIQRLAVLCGTSNYNEVLSDPTGNRRIIPVDVEDINKELFNSINKEELFLEAYRLYREGFDWRVMGSAIGELNEDEEKYTMIIKERDLIQKYFESGGNVRLTSTDIIVEIESITRQKLSVNAVGRELNKLKFVKKTTRLPNGREPKLWCVTRINRQGSIDPNAKQKEPDVYDDDEEVSELPF